MGFQRGWHALNEFCVYIKLHKGHCALWDVCKCIANNTTWIWINSSIYNTPLHLSHSCVCDYFISPVLQCHKYGEILQFWPDLLTWCISVCGYMECVCVCNTERGEMDITLSGNSCFRECKSSLISASSPLSSTTLPPSAPLLPHSESSVFHLSLHLSHPPPLVLVVFGGACEGVVIACRQHVSPSYVCLVCLFPFTPQ